MPTRRRTQPYGFGSAAPQCGYRGTGFKPVMLIGKMPMPRYGCSGATTDPTYCCIQGWTRGGTNIGSDPGFVTAAFRDASEFLDEFNGSRDGSWYEWKENPEAPDTTWVVPESESYLEQTAETGNTLVRDQNGPDLELWFQYYRESDDVGQIFVRWDQSTSAPQDCVALFLWSTYAELVQRVSQGNFVQLDSNNSADTEQETWYNIYVKCEGNDVEVWRAVLGEEMTKILETSSATVTTSDTLVFKQGAGTCRIDDLLLPNNWNDFLHLKRDLEPDPDVISPCVDAGEPVGQGEDPEPFRDFDDHVGPLEGDNDPEMKIRQDMGADEFSTLTPDAFSFWWENFRIVL